MKITHYLRGEFNFIMLFDMKNVVVFEVENVLFDVKNVEMRVEKKMEVCEKEMKELVKKKVDEYLDGSLEGGEFFKWVDEVKEIIEKYRREMKMKLDECVKGSLVRCKLYDGVDEEMDRLKELRKMKRVKVFVVSRYKREFVWKLLESVGMEVDGVYGSVGNMMREWALDKSDVVCFVGDENGKRMSEENGVKGMICKWGEKFGNEEVGLVNVKDIWGGIGLRVRSRA